MSRFPKYPRGPRARFDHAQAIVCRCDPVQFLSVGEDLSRNRRARYCGATGVYRIAECCNNAPDLPDVSNCFV